MAKRRPGVKADPPPAEDVIVDPSPTPVPPVEEPIPSPPGEEGVEEPIEEPILKPDRDVENQLREERRKTQEAEAKFKAVLEASFQMERGREERREPVTPAAIEALYAEAEESNLPKSFVDNMLTAVQGQNAAQMERFRTEHMVPHMQNTVESINRRDVQYLVSRDEPMVAYEEEVMEELRSFGEFRNHPDAAGRAKEIVKGRHVEDILKAGTKAARTAAAEDRRIIRTSPSAATTVTLDSGEKVPLTQEQKDLCVKIDMTEKEYAEGLAAHHKNQPGGVPARHLVAEDD